jgi:hypothetical protein
VSMTNPPNRFEVVTSVQRRRRWTASEKVRMVEETFEPGMTVNYARWCVKYLYRLTAATEKCDPIGDGLVFSTTEFSLGQKSYQIDSAGFSARGAFKGSDFGMKTYLGAIGDDVDLIIEIEAKKKS